MTDLLERMVFGVSSKGVSEWFVICNNMEDRFFNEVMECVLLQDISQEVLSRTYYTLILLVLSFVRSRFPFSIDELLKNSYRSYIGVCHDTGI